ncbi:unnamed protein product [Ectocarpus sp. CCAP 1310/34]|nr:unnamed protein product [Ectocarpus sp. CCAP 1310/34]
MFCCGVTWRSISARFPPSWNRLSHIFGAG